ncbi:MAG: hypothetical protein HOQ44_01955, partial [Nocardia sp.]|nr:hypothetical protein [Nocardia sp.]
MIGRALADLVGNIRDRLVRSTGSGAGVASRDTREFGSVLESGTGEFTGPRAEFRDLMTAQEYARGADFPAPGRSSGPAFDPAAPVSVRNLPPTEQLRFEGAPGEGSNAFVWFEGKLIGVYKPREQHSSIRDEVAAYEADRMLGLDIVPFTREWHGPQGPGSLQEYIPHNDYFWDFRTVEGQKLAVFDYIMGSQDRHMRNALARAGASGRVAAIDNAGVVPDVVGNRMNSMRSPFVQDNLNQPLDAGLVAHLNTIDPQGFAEGLRSLGYSDQASRWAAERLVEVQGGSITGDAWGCAIIAGPHNVLYPPGFASLGEFWDSRTRSGDSS